MTDTKKEIDQDKGDELLKRLLKTPPKPKVNVSLTDPELKEKPSDPSAKKSRSEDR